jgi:hypothetical protein
MPRKNEITDETHYTNSAEDSAESSFWCYPTPTEGDANSQLHDSHISCHASEDEDELTCLLGERPPPHDPAVWTVCLPATTLEVPAIDPVVPTETRSDSGLLVGGGGLGWSSVLHLPLTCFSLSLQDRGGYPYRIGEAIPTG